MKEDFFQLQKFVNAVKNENSVPWDHYFEIEFIRVILAKVYNPNIQFNITSQDLIEHPELCESRYTEFIALLEDLDWKYISGDTAIKFLNGFILERLQYKNLIYSIIDQNLFNR
jgi:hypothetical protein